MCSAAMARSIILLSPPGVPPYEADALVRLLPDSRSRALPSYSLYLISMHFMILPVYPAINIYECLGCFLQVLHTALVLAYLSELKADIVVELAELENVQVLKEVLSTLMNYTTKPLPLTLKSSALISTDPTMIPHTGER